VVHTHPTLVNAVMCSNNAASSCLELFGEHSLFIPYTDPGYILFKKVETEIAAFTAKFSQAPKIIFLENHGVFVAADSISEINELYASIMEKINQRVRTALPETEQKPFISAITGRIGQINSGFEGFTAVARESSLIHFFAKDSATFLKANTAFTPDDIVYCKAYYLFLPACNNDQELIESAGKLISGYVKANGYLPKVLVLEGKGVITIEENLKSALNVLEVYSNILKISFLSNNFGGPKFMNKAQIEFIDNWEVENYRRKMAKS